jgi:arylsulfatase A-like enzyme
MKQSRQPTNLDKLAKQGLVFERGYVTALFGARR